MRKHASMACVNCRKRKIKCDIQSAFPCLPCQKRQIECVLMASDKRKDRYRGQYRAFLEAKVAQYDSTVAELRHHMSMSARLVELLEKLKSATMLDSDDPAAATAGSVGQKVGEGGDITAMKALDGFLAGENGQTAPNLASREDKPLPTKVKGLLHAKNFENDEKYSVSVYGPTSIFNTESVPNRALDLPQMGILSTDTTVVECIKNFFRWQYPDLHLFVFREAFLLDFFNPYSNGVYASKELVYAICAIGALVSENTETRAQALSFYTKSKELLMQNLDSPSITSLQAFLLLGLFDVYNGRNNSGWMLTGDGLRMGFGVGFHLSPENWLVGRMEEVSLITTAVRSRIFWGSFMADRFLGLILGRPSILKMDESTISESINMPAIETISEYTYPGTKDYDAASYIDVSNPLKSIIKLVEISDAMLFDLFSKGTDTKGKQDVAHKLELLQRYNEKILHWRQNLVSILQWDKLTLAQYGHDHTKMFMRYFYYIVLLCLNRPFVEVSKTSNTSKETTNALKICEDAIDDIHFAVVSFVKNHGFSHCLILIVYSCIICISIILLTHGGNLGENTKFEECFFDFMTLLKLLSLTWKLSEKSYYQVRGTFQVEYKLGYEVELSKFLQKKQDLNDGFLVHGNSIISVSGEPHERLSSEFAPQDEHDFANVMDFGGFGGPPVFMNADFADWGDFFAGYGQHE